MTTTEQTGERLVDTNLAADLSAAALDLARRFHDGATLWVISPQWEPHAHHVAVEFVHPVIMGKRALPAVALVEPDPVAQARVASRPGDLLMARQPNRGHACRRPAAADLLGTLERRTAMCLGIPGQVVDIVDAEQHLAKVDVNGVRRTISVLRLTDANLMVGDWGLVHVGFAMAKIDELEAAMTLDQVQKMGADYVNEIEAFNASEIA